MNEKTASAPHGAYAAHARSVIDHLDGASKTRREDLRLAKIARLVEDEGHGSDMDLAAACVTDSVAPGICMTPSCDYSTEVEPDQREGWCEVCEAGTVKSILVLMGII